MGGAREWVGVISAVKCFAFALDASWVRSGFCLETREG